MSTHTKRLEEEGIVVNNQELSVFFDVTASLSESSFSHEFGVQTDRVITCEEACSDVSVYDEDGNEIKDEFVLTEVYNQINSKDYSERFEFSDFED